MRLDLGGCEIRDYVRSDFASLARNANNPRIAQTLRDRFPHPYTEAHARDWVESVRAQDPPTCFAIATGPEVIGGIGLQLQRDVHCRAAELGYWIAEPHWGRGIATRAVQAFTAEAFERYDLLRVYAMVFETNPASARVLEKAGFRCEGRLRMSAVKLGRILDQLLYSRLRFDRP